MAKVTPSSRSTRVSTGRRSAIRRNVSLTRSSLGAGQPTFSRPRRGRGPARRLDGPGVSPHGSPVTATTADARAALPPALGEALAGYEEHLRTQRDLSEHTVRGYVTDAVWLLDHLVRRGGGPGPHLAPGPPPTRRP